MRPFRWMEHLAAVTLTVEGHSMEPTHHQGDRVRMSRLAYWWRDPRRGDVVVVRVPAHPHRLELKRIIGLPHETISWVGGQFQIQQHVLQEPYANIRPSPPGDEPQTVALGADQYVVVGDNRLHSDDSRLYGPVTRSAILGPILSYGKE